MRRCCIGLAVLALAACGAQTERDDPASEATAPANMALTILAVGTEPFWSITAGPGGVIYTDPDLQMNPEADAIIAPGAAFAAERAGLRLSSGDVTLTVRDEPCSDGMSDITYPMGAEGRVLIDGAPRTLSGCAWRRWDHALFEHLATIDACLAAIKPQVRMVSYAARLPDGSTLVRVGGFDASEAQDCTADAAGKLTIAPADSERLLAGLRDIALFRAPGENPGGACYEAEEVRGPDGALIGWLDTLEGC